MRQLQSPARPARPGAKKKTARNSSPAAYLRLVIEIAAERGVDPQRVLHGTRLRPEHLTAPDSRITSADSARVVTNALLLTADPGLGLELGLRTKPTAHGYLGYAVMSCGSMREALDVAIRFVQLRQRDVTLSLGIDGATAVLRVEETHNLGAHRRFFLEGLMVGMASVTGYVLGEAMLDCEICFDWPEPPYYAAYRARLPRMRYAAAAVEIRFDAALLERKPVLANPDAARQAVDLCEREQALAGRSVDDVVRRVRAELVLSEGGYPDLAGVAGRLFTSDRTLKRRLQRCGTSFQLLRDEARQRDAMRLLKNSNLEIRQIASALGYSDPPSFTRAFLRWTGELPSAARLRLQD